MTAPSDPVLQIRGAALRRGDRELWSGLDLEVAPGELVAVLEGWGDGGGGEGHGGMLTDALDGSG